MVPVALSVGQSFGVLPIAGAISIRPLRRLLESLMPQPGSEPTEQTMDEGWFRCELLGYGSQGQRVRSWVRMLAILEIGLLLSLCASRRCVLRWISSGCLDGQLGGILTPSTRLGDVLVERLRLAGMQIEVEAIEAADMRVR